MAYLMVNLKGNGEIVTANDCLNVVSLLVLIFHLVFKPEDVLKYNHWKHSADAMDDFPKNRVQIGPLACQL